MTISHHQLLMGSGASPSDGILDDYSSGAVVAASVRKLFSTATYSFQAKNVSGGATQDIGFVGTALDSSALSSFIGSGSATAPIYYNQADAANPLISVLASDVPVVNSGTFLDGPRTARNSSAYKTTANASGASGVTLFVKMDPQDVGTGGIYHFYMQGPGTSSFPQLKFAMNEETNGNIECIVVDDFSNRLGKAAPNPSAGASILVTMTVSYGSPCVVRVWKDNTEQFSSPGTISTGTADIAAMSASPHRFGIDLGNGNGANCTYRDILIYESVLSDTDIDAINTILLT